MDGPTTAGAAFHDLVLRTMVGRVKQAHAASVALDEWFAVPEHADDVIVAAAVPGRYEITVGSKTFALPQVRCPIPIWVSRTGVWHRTSTVWGVRQD